MSKNRIVNPSGDFGRIVDGVYDAYAGVAKLPERTSVREIAKATGYSQEDINRQLLIAYGRDTKKARSRSEGTSPGA